MIRLHSGYLLVAAVSVLLGTGIAIWLNNELLTSPVTLFLFFAGLASTVVTAIANFRQAFEVSTDQSQPLKSGQQHKALLTPEESVRRYLSNLEASISSSSVTSLFVELDAETRQSDESHEIELLQSFEWARIQWTNERQLVQREPIELLRAHERFQRYVLLGDPGSGKTTSLQYVVLTMIASHKSGHSSVLPLYVSLADWKAPRTSAIDFLTNAFANLAGPGSDLPDRFASLLSGGELLVVLDGLNEMPRRYHKRPAARRRDLSFSDVVSEATSGAWLSSGQDPRERPLRELATSVAIRSHFIVSCRTHEFHGSPSWPEVYVLPMTTEQIRAFIGKRLASGASDLERVLANNQSLRALASNPFFLLSMTTVFQPELAAVHGPGQFIEFLLTRLLLRESERGGTVRRKDLIRDIGRLAFRMIHQEMIGSQFDLRALGNRRKLSIETLLRTGLVVSRGDRLYFYHQLIQEFFAAVALRDHHVFAPIGALLCQKKWSEVMMLWNDIDPNPRLFAALVHGLGMRHRPWTLPFHPPGMLQILSLIGLIPYSLVVTNLLIDLLVGGSMLAFAINSPTAFLTLFLTPYALRYLWLFSTRHAGGIGNAAYVLGRIQVPTVVPNLIESFRHVPPASEAAKQISMAAARFGSLAVPHLRAGLMSDSRPIRLGVLSALGELGTKDAADVLLPMMSTDDMELLKRVIEAAGRINDKRVGPALLAKLRSTPNDSMLDLALESAFYEFAARHQLDDTLAADLNNTILDRELAPRQRRLAIKVASFFAHESLVGAFSQLVQDRQEDTTVRSAAAVGLGALHHPHIIGTILTLFDEVTDYQKELLSALAAVQGPHNQQSLQKVVYHTDWRIRHAAVVALSRAGDPHGWDKLLEFANDSNQVVRNRVAWAIGAIGGAAAIEHLKRLVRDEVHEIRVAAIENLDFFHPHYARGIFIELASDQTFPDRTLVIDKLANYQNQDVRSVLLDISLDPQPGIRARALDALEKLDTHLSRKLRPLKGKRPRNFRGLSHRVWSYASDWFQVKDLIALFSESRFSSTAELDEANKHLRALAEYEVTDGDEGKPPDISTNASVWYRAIFVGINRMMNDADIRRRLRTAVAALLGLILITFCVLPGVLAAVLGRLGLFVGGLVLHAWAPSLVIVTLAALSYLPRVRSHPSVLRIPRLIFCVRVIGILILVALFLHIVAKYWIRSAVILAVAAVAAYLRRQQILDALSQFAKNRAAANTIHVQPSARPE